MSLEDNTRSQWQFKQGLIVKLQELPGLGVIHFKQQTKIKQQQKPLYFNCSYNFKVGTKPVGEFRICWHKVLVRKVN